MSRRALRGGKFVGRSFGSDAHAQEGKPDAGVSRKKFIRLGVGEGRRGPRTGGAKARDNLVLSSEHDLDRQDCWRLPGASALHAGDQRRRYHGGHHHDRD